MGASGAALRLRVYEQAGYAWDLPAFSGDGRPGRVIAEAWPELAALSASEVAGFFARAPLGQALGGRGL